MTQHWNDPLLFKQLEVLVKVKFLVTLFSALVQLQSQYHVFEVAFVTFLHEQDWLEELVAQVNLVVLVVVLVVELVVLDE